MKGYPKKILAQCNKESRVFSTTWKARMFFDCVSYTWKKDPLRLAIENGTPLKDSTGREWFVDYLEDFA